MNSPCDAAYCIGLSQGLPRTKLIMSDFHEPWESKGAPIVCFLKVSGKLCVSKQKKVFC